MQPWAPHGKSYYKCVAFQYKEGKGDNKPENNRIKATERETARLTHYLSRFHAHFRSSELEEKMVSTAAKRMEEMQKATAETVQTQFVQIAFQTLFLCRVTLGGCYIYRFFAEKGLASRSRQRGLASRLANKVADTVGYLRGTDIAAFDRLHAGLEKCTEALSNVVARRRWKATRASVLRLTLEAFMAREALFKHVEAAAQSERTARSSSASPARRSTQAAEWSCVKCTYKNAAARTSCEMCGNARPKKGEANCALM
jgi:hypothetical protein